MGLVGYPPTADFATRQYLSRMDASLAEGPLARLYRNAAAWLDSFV